MHKLIPPFCLFLALVSLIAAFGLLAVEPPEPSVQLHAARVQGTEDLKDALEAKLGRSVSARRILIGGLFAGTGVLTVAAFVSMRPSGG